MTKPQNTGGWKLLPTPKFLHGLVGQKLHHKHNEELQILYNILRCAGIKHINTNHIHLIGTNSKLPLRIGKKEYDISYISPTGKVILLELKWTENGE